MEGALVVAIIVALVLLFALFLVPYRGRRGHRGFPGSDGLPGECGPVGEAGEAGARGANGAQGSQGRGAQGAQGPQNSGGQGAQGPQGAQGFGSQGTQGSQGVGAQGSQGSGAQGNQGVQGGEGAQGIVGLQGVQGLGAQGNQGLEGAQGIQGSGAQGVQGIQGLQGAQGGQGIQGFTGPQGATAAAEPFFVNNTVFVDIVYGEDATGVPEDPTHPYQTLAAGNAAAIANGTPSSQFTVYVQPGQYISPVGGLLLSPNTNWFFTAGADVTNSADSPIFIYPAGLPTIVTVIAGYGVFQATTAGTTTTDSGILHVLSDGEVTFQGVRGFSDFGPAFYSGAGVTSSASRLHVDLPLLSSTGAPAFQIAGSASMDLAVNDIIAVNSSVVLAEMISGVTLSSFITLVSDRIIASGTTGATGSEGVFVNHANSNLQLMIHTSLLDARNVHVPVHRSANSVAGIGSSNTFIESQIVVIGGGDTGPFGGLISADNVVNVDGSTPRVEFDCDFLISIAPNPPLPTISAVNTMIFITATSFFVALSSVTPTFVLTENSTLSIRCDTLQAFAAGPPPLLRLFDVGPASTLVVDASSELLAQTQMLASADDSTRCSFTSPKITVLTGTPAQAAFVLAAALNSVEAAQMNIQYTGATAADVLYSLIECRGAETIWNVDSLDVSFSGATGAVPPGNCNIFNANPIASDSLMSVRMESFNWDGDNTTGLITQANTTGLRVNGEITSMRAGPSSFTTRACSLLSGDIHLTNNEMALSSTETSFDATVLNIEGFSIIPTRVRLTGNEISVAGGRARGVVVDGFTDVILNVGEIRSDRGTAYRVLASSGDGPARVQTIVDHISTIGTPTSVSNGGVCIDLEAIPGATATVDISANSINTGNCFVGIDVGFGGGVVDASIRTNLFTVGRDDSSNIQQGILKRGPGVFVMEAFETQVSGLTLPGGTPDAAFLHATEGTVTFSGQRLVQTIGGESADAGRFASVFEGSTLCTFLDCTVSSIECPSRAMHFGMTAPGVGIFRVDKAITQGATEAAIGVTAMDCVVFVDGSGEYTFSGVLINGATVGDVGQTATVVLFGPDRERTAITRMRASTLVYLQGSSASFPFTISTLGGVQILILEPSSANLPEDGFAIGLVPPSILFTDPAVR